MPQKLKQSQTKKIKKFSQKELDNLKKEVLGIAKIIDEREAELKKQKKKKKKKLKIRIKKPKLKIRRSKEEDVMGAKILYFESGNTAKMVNKKIKDGTIDMGDKTHIIDTHDPIMLKKGRWPFTSFEPMFILKHDEINPAKNLNPIRPEFAVRDKKGNIIKDRVNPELLKKTMSMKVLGNMLKVRKSISPLILIILGLAMGGFLVYYLIAMKVIKI